MTLAETRRQRELPVSCVPTGVKHLHRAAEKYDVGVYFEANGHGTVLFSPKARATLEEHAQTLKDSPSTTTPTTFTHLNNLMHLTELINETVGDAFSDMLLVEVILAHKAFSGGVEWDSLYTDLPNRLLKVQVKDRNAFVTTDQERRLVEPRHIQPRLDVLVKKYEAGRAFVRPSGTEDVVRIYAEAARRAEADGMLLEFLLFGSMDSFLFQSWQQRWLRWYRSRSQKPFERDCCRSYD